MPIRDIRQTLLVYWYNLSRIFTTMVINEIQILNNS